MFEHVVVVGATGAVGRIVLRLLEERAFPYRTITFLASKRSAGTKVRFRGEEHTVAELLKDQGYATMCIGKWHLGDQPPFLPTRHGFDHYFGIPYSNDMNKPSAATGQPVVPLLRDEKVVDLLDGNGQNGVTARYTEEAVKFIRGHREKPFFLYFPHTAVHTPLHPGDNFRGK